MRLIGSSSLRRRLSLGPKSESWTESRISVVRRQRSTAAQAAQPQSQLCCFPRRDQERNRLFALGTEQRMPRARPAYELDGVQYLDFYRCGKNSRWTQYWKS